MKFRSFSLAEIKEINRRASALLRSHSDVMTRPELTDPFFVVPEEQNRKMSEAIRREFLGSVTFDREEIRRASKVASRRLAEQ